MKCFISFDFAIGLLIFITVLSFSIITVNEEVKETLLNEKITLSKIEAYLLKKEIEQRYLDVGYKYIIIPKGISNSKTCFSLSIGKEYKYYVAYSGGKPICMKEENSTVTIYSKENALVTLFASNDIPLKHLNCSLDNCKEIQYNISSPEKVKIFNKNKNINLSALSVHSEFCLDGLTKYSNCKNANLNFVYYYLTQNNTSLRMDIERLKIGINT